MTQKNMINVLKNPSPETFFILDIDSTLVTTHQRNQAIIDNFIHEKTGLDDKARELLSKAQCRLGDYGTQSALERISFNQQAPHITKDLLEFWRQHFFSNRFLKHDQPTPGAVEWVTSLIENNCGLFFLTARHHQTMWPGTLASMKALGFPVTKNNLFLKEDLSVPDEEFKSRKLQELRNSLDLSKTIFIDNEPVVLNRIDQDHPTVTLVFFDSVHSGRMSPPSKAHHIQDFLF